LGFKTVMLPSANRPRAPIDDVAIIPVDRVDAAIDYLRK
jgi:hypothetical protein